MPPKRKTKVGVGAGAEAPQLQLRVPGTPQRVTSPASESESKLETTATASGTCSICALPIVEASETNEAKQLSSVRVTASAGITAGARA